MNQEPAIVGLQQPVKPRVRVRTHLTSFQLDKDQKQTIDEAYNIFTAESGQFVSKGQFVEGLALDYLKKSNRSSGHMLDQDTEEVAEY